MRILTWLRAMGCGPGRRLRLERLREAVQAHSPVLPVAGAQLREANQQIEKAVAKVGANFERMVERAQQGVNEASRLVGAGGGGDTAGVESLLAGSRATLEELLARIEEDGKRCERLLERMAHVDGQIEKIVGALADIDRISFGNTILALNAKIEAAHMGDRGQGFEIVAQELWRQSQKSEGITETVRQTIAELLMGSMEAAGDVSAMACADSKQITAMRSSVHEALTRMERTHQEMQSAIAGAAERNQELSKDIAGAVVEMQFQDRVAQQIAHVVEALEAMQMALTEPLGVEGRGRRGAAPVSEAARLLAGSYTMEGERAVHAAASGEHLSTHKELDDVEIF